MLTILGFLLLAAAAAALWLTFRPVDRSEISDIKVPMLLYGAVLIIGGVFAVANVSWSLLPYGLWLMVGGGIVATTGLALFAWITPDFLWGPVLILLGSLAALAGPVGLGVTYLARHIVVSWV